MVILNKLKNGSKIAVLMISNEGSMTGAPLFLERLATGLSESNYRVVVFFSGSGPIISRMRSDGFEVYSSIKRSGSISKSISLYYRFAHYLRFLKTLLLVKPDIVYSNTIVNCGEVILSRICGFTTLVHMHEGMNFAARMKRKLSAQTFVCNDVIVGSEYAGRVLCSLTGYSSSVIPIGVSGISVSDSVYMPNPKNLRVGILGTLDENKGQLVALKALALAVDRGMSLQLIIAGAEVDSNYSLKLRNFVVEHGLEARVDFLGRIESVDSFFQSIDVLLVCSYDEVFPTVILEAMREKKLVVASRVGGIPEIIEHGITGFLYEAGSTEELSQLLSDISGSNGLPSEIIDRAYQKFIVLYEISNSVEAISKRFWLLL